MLDCFRIMICGFAFWMVITGSITAPERALAVEISDGPMEALIHTAPPVLMFLLDNSGSMNSELMTPEEYGLFENACYVFPDDAYIPGNDHVYGAGHGLREAARRAWKTQWSGYNRLYYCPEIVYAPWPSTARHVFNHSGLNRPRSNPVGDKSGHVRVNLAATFCVVKSGGADIAVTNAHYFVRPPGRGGQQIYLVTWEDADLDGILDLGNAAQNDRRKYYRFVDDGNDLVDDNELIEVMDEGEKNMIRPGIVSTAGAFERYRTDREDLQNFANWCTYHRRRELAAKAAVAGMLTRSEKKLIGLYAINGSPRMAVRPVRATSAPTEDGVQAGDGGEKLLNALYGMESGGTTPLRQALDQVGRYCHQALPSALGPSPFLEAPQGGGCQRSSVVVVTDGFWNGPAPGVGNADGDNGQPYADGWADTLADVAIHYYENDLAPGLPDLVPPIGCDDVSHQHMTTYTLSFGLPGANMQAEATEPYKIDSCLFLDSPLDITWHPPYEGTFPEMPEPLQTAPFRPRNPTSVSASDDLWHAAINGRGNYWDIYSDTSPDAAFPNLLISTDAFASISGIAADGGFYSDQSVVYQARYRTDNWSGDVMAIKQGGSGEVLWRASDDLRTGGTRWDTRNIVTYGGGWRYPEGVPFRYRSLSPGQMAAMGSDLESQSIADRQARALVDYIRGRNIEGFRVRDSLLGDIIHSTPVLFGNTIFVGSNDGMLHAFNSKNGKERFAYVPNLVLSNLKALASQSYLDHHSFYVDGPVFAGEVLVGKYARKAYLVGGLGKGGKGYYCMLVGHRERLKTGDAYGEYQWLFHVDKIEPGGSEQDLAQYIQWEYPKPQPDDDDMDNDQDGRIDEIGESDPHLGYSFSQAYCVNGNTPEGTYRPVVIFGNGYNSDSRSAVLYVLSADTGTLIRKIDTGMTEDNGLSTPALIDVDLDRRVDYAYAGDLRGNLWKFDLTADNPARWGVAYGDDKDGDGVIDASQGDLPAPLFQAVNQPITGRPDVMVMKSICAPEAPGYMVVFGTGQYLGMPDRSDQRQQSIYGVWDYGDDGDDSEHLGAIINRRGGTLTSGFQLVPQDIEKAASDEGNSQFEIDGSRIEYDIVEDDTDGDGLSVNNPDDSQQGNPEKYVGWFYDFPPSQNGAGSAAERVTGDAALRGGKMVVTSYVPDNTPCGSGGNSRLYILTGCDGAITKGPDGASLLPIKIEGMLDMHPIILKDRAAPRIDKILTSTRQGRMLTIDFLGERWGKVSWYQNSDD